MSLAAVASDSSLRVKQFRHRHPFVPVGTGSAGGRSEHQQSWPGLQEMGALHCEQSVFIVEFKFSVSCVNLRSLAPVVSESEHVCAAGDRE